MPAFFGGSKQLVVYQIIVYNLFGPDMNAVHAPDPFHLISGLELFGYALALGHLADQKVQHGVGLLVDLNQVSAEQAFDNKPRIDMPLGAFQIGCVSSSKAADGGAILRLGIGIGSRCGWSSLSRRWACCNSFFCVHAVFWSFLVGDFKSGANRQVIVSHQLVFSAGFQVKNVSFHFRHLQSPSVLGTACVLLHPNKQLILRHQQPGCNVQGREVGSVQKLVGAGAGDSQIVLQLFHAEYSGQIIIVLIHCAFLLLVFMY